MTKNLFSNRTPFNLVENVKQLSFINLRMIPCSCDVDESGQSSLIRNITLKAAIQHAAALCLISTKVVFRPRKEWERTYCGKTSISQ